MRGIPGNCAAQFSVTAHAQLVLAGYSAVFLIAEPTVYDNT